MPQLERFLIIWKVLYTYVQGRKHSESSTIFLYLRLSYTLYSTVFFDKDVFHEIFQVGACPNLKDSSFMIGFLSICTRHEAFGFFDCFALSVTPLCFVRYFCWKRMTFHDIFQIGACQNLKDSSLYDRFSIQMYKAWSIRYFQHFSSICDYLMPSKVLFFRRKRWFFLIKYFKLVHAQTWNIPRFMKVYLFICTRHEAFGIFHFFALSETPNCYGRYIVLEKRWFLS